MLGKKLVNSQSFWLAQRHTEVSSLPGDDQGPMVSSTEIQGSWCQPIIPVQVVFAHFSDHKCHLGSFVLKLGQVDDDETPFSEFILSQLCS